MDQYNFLKQVGQIPTAGGDGILQDLPLSLYDFVLASDGSALTTTLATNPGWAIDSNRFVLQWASTKVVPAQMHFPVPRDYDNTANVARLRVDGFTSTATTVMKFTVYRHRAGVAVVTLGPVTSVALSSTSSVQDISFSGLDIKAGDVLNVKAEPNAANATGSTSLCGLQFVYKSAIVNDAVAARV